jgi:hypothetical protein
MRKWLRFADLVERGTVRNWPQLKNLQTKQGFPLGRKFGGNTRVFSEAEVEDWENSRPTEPKPCPEAKVLPRRKPGRPRKHHPEVANTEL